MVIAIILGLLALFSLISFVLGTDDGRQRGYTPGTKSCSGCGSGTTEPSGLTLAYPTRSRSNGASFDSRRQIPPIARIRRR